MIRRILAALTALAAFLLPAPFARALTFSHLQDNSLIAGIIADSVSRFEADHPGIDVETNCMVNELYKRSIAIAAATNSLPDVFVTWGGANLRQYVRLGKVCDLTQWMGEDGYAERFLDGATAQVTFDGGIWAVPVENVSLALVFYNKEMFAAYDLVPPETYDDLLHVIAVLRDHGITPFALANANGWTGSMYYMYLVDRLGGHQAFLDAMERDAEGKPLAGAGFEAEALEQAWQYVIDLNQMGAFPPNCNSMDEDAGESRQMLYSGQAGMLLIGTWTISRIREESPESWDRTGLFEFPAIGEATGGVMGTLGDNFYSVSSSCQDPETAFRMIQYLLDDEAARARMAVGVNPPLKDAKAADELSEQVLAIAREARYVQLWYDQTLPQKLAETHKDICRSVFGGEMTAREAAAAMERAAVEYYGRGA